MEKRAGLTLSTAMFLFLKNLLKVNGGLSATVYNFASSAYSAAADFRELLRRQFVYLLCFDPLERDLDASDMRSIVLTGL
jgi:hypothetical protein